MSVSDAKIRERHQKEKLQRFVRVAGDVRIQSAPPERSKLMQTPYSLAAEQTIVGTVIIRPQVLTALDGNLSPNDFFAPECRKAYRAALDLHRRNEPVDVVAIHELAKVPLESLTNIAEFATVEDAIPHHAATVLDKSAKRRALAALQGGLKQIGDDNLPVDEIVSGAVSELRRCYLDNDDASAGFDLTMDFARDCEYRFKNPNEAKALGVATGFQQLDQFLTYDGVPRGHVTIIAGATNSGKSALELGIFRNAAHRGVKCLDLTLEDRKSARIGRHISAVSGIDIKSVQSRTIPANDWQRAHTAFSTVDHHPVKYLDQRQPVETLLAKAHRIINEDEIELFGIDYFQLLSTSNPQRTRQETVDYVFEQIEAFAGNHPQTATLLVSQMSRHDGRPQLRNLYHSAKLEQGAHTVVLVWAPDLGGHYKCRAVDVAKQKDGPRAIRVLGWDGPCVRFFDAERPERENYFEAIKNLEARNAKTR